VYRSADDKTYALRILERFLDNWKLKLVEELTTLVLLLFSIKVLVFTIENNLSLEINGAVFKQVFKEFIFQFIDGVQHWFLKSWLKLLKEEIFVKILKLCLMLQLLGVEVSDIVKDLLK